MTAPLERLREDLAKVARNYPNAFGESYIAYGEIGHGQDVAAKDISKAIEDFDLSAYSPEAPSDLSAATPRTDALARAWGKYWNDQTDTTPSPQEPFEYARQLERELSALEQKNTRLTEALQRCLAHFDIIRHHDREDSPMMAQARAALKASKE